MRVLSGRYGQVLLTYARRPAFRVLAVGTFAIAGMLAWVVAAGLNRYSSGVVGSFVFVTAFAVMFSPVVLLVTFVATLMLHLREQLENSVADLAPGFRRAHLTVAAAVFIALPLAVFVAVFVFVQVIWALDPLGPTWGRHANEPWETLVAFELGVLAVTLSLMTLTALWASFRSPWFSLLMVPLFLLAFCWQRFGAFVNDLVSPIHADDVRQRVLAAQMIAVDLLLLVLVGRRLLRGGCDGRVRGRSVAQAASRPQPAPTAVIPARRHRAIVTPLSRAWHRRHGVLSPTAPWLVGAILSLMLVLVTLLVGHNRADLLRSLLLPTLVPGVVISLIWRERWSNLGYESLYPARRSDFVRELAGATAINLAELWVATTLAVLPPVAIWDTDLLKSPMFYVTLASSAAMQFLVFGVMFVAALSRPLLPYVNLVTVLATLIPIAFAWAENPSLSPHGLLVVSVIEMACGVALALWGYLTWCRADLA